jgi:hypothetical protein
MISGTRKIFHGIVGTLKSEIELSFQASYIFKILLAEQKLSIFYPMVFIVFFGILCSNVLPVFRLLTKRTNVKQWNTKEPKYKQRIPKE